MNEPRRLIARGNSQSDGAPLRAYSTLRAGDSKFSFAASELKAALAISVPVSLIVALICAGFVLVRSPWWGQL